LTKCGSGMLPETRLTFKPICARKLTPVIRIWWVTGGLTRKPQVPRLMISEPYPTTLHPCIALVQPLILSPPGPVQKRRSVMTALMIMARFFLFQQHLHILTVIFSLPQIVAAHGTILFQDSIYTEWTARQCIRRISHPGLTSPQTA